MGTLEISSSKTHIIFFPWPAKGHMNPMLHFANRLIAKDVKVTIVTTATTFKSVKSKATSMMSIESIVDGVEETSNSDVETYFRRFRTAATRSFSELIERLISCDDDRPKVVVYDSTMPWVLDIAQGFGLRGASFFTQSCSVCAIYYHMLQGTITEKPKNDTTVISLPSMPPLNRNDLPEFDFLNDVDPNRVVIKHLLDQFSNIDKVDCILFNSFDNLEIEVVNWMASQWPIKTIGPTAPSLSLGKEVNKNKEDRNYLFETNTEACLKWLDKRETCSVIYASMGSIATLGEEQMGELGQGLIRSNCYFLWVVRDEEESKLPKNFKSETLEKGLVINWCPQLDVLSHRAVACFMTHCGWNSTLEALVSGVPMIAFPQFVDQTTNAKFIADVWKAGVRVKADEKGMVTGDEIERCIKDVVQNDKGKEMKRNALQWKKLAKEAMEEGGSSERNLEQFVSTLLSIA